MGYQRTIEQLYRFALGFMAISLPLSESLVSVGGGLILLMALLHPDWNSKWERLKHDKTILLVLSIYAVFLLGTIFTTDMKTAMYDLRKNMFIPMLTIGIGLGPYINRKQLGQTLWCFLAAINIAVIVGFVKFLFRDQFQIENSWDISFISHIRFSFQLILAACLLLYIAHKQKSKLWNWQKKLLLFDAFLMLLFVFIQKSLIGILGVGAVTIVGAIILIRLIAKVWLKRLVFFSFLALIISVPAYIGLCIYQFYNVEKVDVSNLEQYTSLGNAYTHNLNSKLIENGHYTNLYVCVPELRKSWNKRSSIDYDGDTQTGFMISTTLVRYLTAKGLRKDADGVAALTAEDIKNIESGIANPIFKNRFASIYPRIYKTIWEIDVYMKTDDANYKSLAQRIVFAKAACSIISENFFWGVGTGNWKKAFWQTFQKNNPTLKEELYASAHNQYLNYAVKFGIIGMLWIMWAWLAPVFMKKRFRFFPMLMLWVIMGVANLGDSNFESHMGLSFFMFFYSMFLWSETETSININ